MPYLQTLIIVFCLSILDTDLFSPKYTKEIEAHRKELDKMFKDPSVSPLKDKAHTYKGQSYYAPNKTYRVKAKLERTPGSQPFELATSNPKRKKSYVRYGVLHFSLKGKGLSLEVYRDLSLSHLPQNRNRLFLPFADKTSGIETYGGGRYMNLVVPKGNKMVLDFNLAYNPYCAYSDGWSCPIIPRQNFLDVEIEAGVKKYAPH